MQDVDNKMAEIACALLGLHGAIKINHWQTRSFAHHKATDELLETLSSLTDKFMEALQGAQGRRLDFGFAKCSIPLYNVSDQDAIELIKSLRESLLVDFPRLIALTPGLTNIRDEMVTALDTTLYLLTFQ